MRKILLSAITLMMSVAMMAIGLGDGTSKANAIDFDWANGNVHESSEALWYDVDMTPVDDAKYLVLYLTNLADEAATVHIDMSVQGYDANMSGIDTIIAAGDYYRFEFPKEMINTLLETYGLSAYADKIKDLSLSLQSDQKVMLAANVYTTEAEFIQQEVLTHLEEIDWNKGVKQDALSTKWYEVDITSVKNNQQHLQVSFKNYANETAVLAVSFILNNEIHTLPIPVPAGFERSQVIDYQILRLVPSKTIKVGVTTTATIEVATSVKSALAEDQTPCLTAIDPQHGVEYTQAAGTTQWYKLSLDWLESQADYSSLYLANKGSQTAHVTIGMVPDCKYTTGTKVTLPIPAGFDLGLVAPNIVGRLLNELSRLERLYGKVDSKDVYLEIHADQELGFGLDVVNETTNPCLREDLISFDWNKGATLTPNVAQWYDIDITKVKDSGKHIKLTFTNPTNTIVWVASVVSIDCPAKLTMPMIMPIYPGMSVDKVIDYSFMAAQPIDNIYVGVVAEEAIIMGAATIDAVVEEPIDCINHVEVKSGERYVHNAGTTWYKFSNELLEDMGKAPRFTFENLSSNAITFTAGVTVDCKYGILTHAKAKIPAHILGQHLHNREFAVRIPRVFFQAARKLIDPDVTEFMLQLTANNPFAFSIDMKADDACDDAQEFDWKGCFDLKANQSAWYKVDVNTPLNSKEPITVALYNNSDYPVIVSAEVSPTCPSLISMVEKYEIGALDSVIVSVKPEKVAEMVKEYSDYLSNLSCYARFHATGDVTVCVNDERIINPDDPTIDEDECKDVPELDWKKEIVLSDLVMNQMYKLNIKGLYDAKYDIELWVNNDVHTDSVIISSEVYKHCDETSPVAKHQNKVAAGENWPLIAYDKFAALVTPEQNNMYVIFTAIDTIPVTPDTPCETIYGDTTWAKFCDEAYTWNGIAYSTEGTYYQKYVAANGCDSIVTLVLTKNCGTPDPDPCVTVYGDTTKAKFCDSFNWNGQFYTAAGTYQQTIKTVNACDSIITLILTEDCPAVDECENAYTEVYGNFCEPVVWNGITISKTGTYEATLTKTDGCDSIVTLHMEEKCEPVIPPTPECEDVKTEFSAKFCENPYIWNGVEYAVAGDHIQTFPLASGCDSIVTLHLTKECPQDPECVTVYGEFDATFCEQYNWNGVIYTKAGDYEQRFVAVTGCDSIVTMHLTEDCEITDECEDVETEFTAYFCESFTWNKEVYTKAGDYKQVLSKTDGCDSIVTLHLIENCPGEDCENAIALDWSDVKLSQLVEGNWYKLDFSEVHANQSSATFKATNDLNGDATVSAAAYYHCEDVDAMGEATKKLVQGHVGEREVSYKELTDVIGHASVLYVQVTDITVIPEPVEKDTVVNNVTEFVCDGTEYVDLQGEKHIVSSLIDPALLTWTTTIETETTVTVYNYVITPIVAPVVMTVDVLATIPGATPVLVAGEKVDVTGTVEAIKNYYDMNDTEAIADVETVVWTAGADATLACDADSHTMILTVTSGCEFVWSAELTFDVTPAEDKEFNVTACDSYEWHGVTYTESGDYTFEAECYKEILHLTINETEVVELTETACESYEWHGETYTESGDYTFEDECYKEILHLTINTVVTEDVTASDCYAYEWNGVTYTKSGNYTFNTTSVVTGCDSIVTLHLTITAETPEENPALGNAEAVVKYGNRLVVLHLNGFAEKYGWTPANDQVTWYQVVGEMDNSWEIVDDKVLGSGMYIEDLNGFTGQIYAIIDSSNEGACGNLYRTKVLVLAPAGQAPKLMPTIARPSEDLHLLNLNSANVAEVRVYNTSGELMSVYKAEEASEFVFKAETLPGYYLVEVQHNGEQTTLRYIVK